MTEHVLVRRIRVHSGNEVSLTYRDSFITVTVAYRLADMTPGGMAVLEDALSDVSSESRVTFTVGEDLLVTLWVPGIGTESFTPLNAELEDRKACSA